MMRPDLLDRPTAAFGPPALPRDPILVDAAADWTFAGVWPGGQPVWIGGVDVWSVAWRAENVPEVHTRDPAYGGVWRLPVYTVPAGVGRATFLAAEVSNGMWAFYVRKTSEQRGVPLPPGLPAVATRGAGVTVGRPAVLRTLAAFVPLGAAVFSVPWTVFVALAHMGGPGPAAQNPQWRTWFMAEMLLPSALGLLLGLLILGAVRPRGAVAWGGWGLGVVACVAVFVTLCVIG